MPTWSTRRSVKLYVPIKGSGAMFGFDRVAGFTHHVETAFDLVRKGQTAITPGLIAVSLAPRIISGASSRRRTMPPWKLARRSCSNCVRRSRCRPTPKPPSLAPPRRPLRSGTCISGCRGRGGDALVTEGEETELDKTLIERLGDPLIHLIRNAADHGLKSPERRLAAGKPAQGRIVLAARHLGHEVLISISDDGGGLDHARILQCAEEQGLLPPGGRPHDARAVPGAVPARFLDRARGHQCVRPWCWYGCGAAGDRGAAWQYRHRQPPIDDRQGQRQTRCVP